MSWLGIALLIFLGLGALSGWRRGLVAVAFDIAGLVVGLVLAHEWQATVTVRLEKVLPVGHWIHTILPRPADKLPFAVHSAQQLAHSILGVLVFIAIVLATEAVARFVAAVVTGIIKRIILVRSLNTLGGLVGGLLENAVIAGLVLGLVLAVPFVAHGPVGGAVRQTPLAKDLVNWVALSVHWPVKGWVI